MTEPSGVSSPKELKMALYARCASLEEGRVFSQDDLLSFNIIPDNNVQQLLIHTKQLAKDGLFKVMSKDNKICWKVVKKADAAKYVQLKLAKSVRADIVWLLRYKALGQDEALVFSYIETAQREGIWSRLLRNKTNLHMTTMNRAVKSLENKNLIKSIKTVKFPNRKTYMLAKLQPSEDVTGGPFHTDGVLDEEFVYQMSHWTEKYIIGRSWWLPDLPELTKKKSSSKLTQVQAEQLRAEYLRRKGHGRDRDEAMLPCPVGYKGYPTLAEITRAINDSGLSGVVMKESEMKQLIDILCWDGRIERIRKGKAYRAIRLVGGEDGVSLENGLTESPCGRCPVFEICEEDGPVNARTCHYFQEWVEM